jgi:hypothetical protein
MRNSNYLKVILYVVLALSLFSGLVMTAVGIMAGLFTHKIGSVNGNDDYAYVLILGTFMAAIGVGMITRASLFIAFISKRDMEELQQNRWALIVLALGISSFWIPFILRRTTGYGVSSTSDVPVKYYLGKWFSMIWFVSAIAFVCAFLFVSSYQIGDEGGLISFGTTGYLNDFVYSTAKMQSLNNGIFYALIGITAFQLFIGILAVPAFYFPNSLESYQNGGAFKVYMLIFGWFFTMWATVLLVFAILSAFLEIVNALGNAFGNNRGGMVSRIFSIIALPFIIAMQGYIIMVCGQTIKGIWSRSDQVSYNTYSRVETLNRGTTANTRF